ncbi:redoxin domain-containing protein [Thermocoleostomius sinensis]|uniref:Redoxin domain-containing protein n=1 Tax=Thermocoleostomius sinensis A174 TaxID=2016057 RepID=A0A9E9C363_9CYAN|nr:2OG-Fe(II) oxygenase [Thermocoleostomius sinensis]WAL58636.1 redoxin domain-containing protein [Thermocoleostomius sinensis A174]
MEATLPLTVGDPAPWFILPSIANYSAHLDTLMGGYRAVLFFFGSAKNFQVKAVLDAFLAMQEQFVELDIPFFGVGVDLSDRSLEQHVRQPSHFKFIWDVQGEVSIRYGVCQLDREGQIAYEPTTFVLDRNLHILNIIPLETHRSHVSQVSEILQQLPSVTPPQVFSQLAPVLIVPNVLSPDFCQHLISLYEAAGGTESGFLKQEGDKTVLMVDSTVKRRRDLLLTDAALVEQVNRQIWRRIQPEIEKSFQFRITQFERYVVACYEDTQQGFFQPHRDNRSIGTAHRRFAMTINLNAGEYEGGCLRFPEFGDALYRPETGSAIVFSCSLLHEATPVTQGRRFALLSFFYNDADAKLRQQTQPHVVREANAVAEIVKHRTSKPPHRSRGFQPKPPR